MQVGQTFMRDGSRWIAKEVHVEENQRFQWLRVLADWSGVGPRPLWANDRRTFLLDRKKKS